MKKLLLGLLLVSNAIFSQEYKLGRVTVEELSQKRHTTDTSAVAAILFKTGNTEFQYTYGKGFNIVTEVSTKIKIYKKEGLEKANQVLRYYSYGGTNEVLSVSDAATYNLVAGKVVKSKLKGEGIFDENINKYWKRKKLNFSDVKEGTIIEFKYRLTSPLISEFRDWDFQSDIPVEYSEYVTQIPEYFQYNEHFKGGQSPKIERDNRETNFTGTYQEMVNQIGGVKSERGTYNIKCKLNISTFKSSNIPALRDESFVRNIDNYTSSIVFELSSVQMPNHPFENYATSWEDVVLKIYENPSFGNELNKTGYFESDINKILVGVTERNQKIAAIFNFVKSNVKWNQYFGYGCDEGVKSAYKNKTGNIAEINLMLTAMLRYAGLEANPVLVSTIDNGIAVFPSRAAFNYVIAAVEIENDLILLDATSPFAMPNILPDRALNWYGRIIRKYGSSAQVDLSPKMMSKDITNLMATINIDGTIDGDIRIQKSDYIGFHYRSKYNSLSTDEYLEKLEKKLNNSKIDNFKLDNKLELEKPIVEMFHFMNNNSVERINEKLYFNPLLFFSLEENYFKLEARDYPIEFVCPNQDKYIFNIVIPEGYQVETMPKPMNLVFGDSELNFKFNMSQNENKLTIISSLDINASVISPERYQELKAFFNEVVKKQTEKIVLKKA